MNRWEITFGVNGGEYSISIEIIAEVCHQVSDKSIYVDKVLVLFREDIEKIELLE